MKLKVPESRGACHQRNEPLTEGRSGRQPSSRHRGAVGGPQIRGAGRGGREFPLAAHVAGSADQEVEDHQLIGTRRCTAIMRVAASQIGRSGRPMRCWRNNSTGEMLLPYIKEPADRPRMPAHSTGGAATKATMKQMVQASKGGINQHTEPNRHTGRCWWR